MAVRYDDGQIADERVAGLELLTGEEAPDEEEDEAVKSWKNHGKIVFKIDQK